MVFSRVDRHLCLQVAIKLLIPLCCVGSSYSLILAPSSCSLTDLTVRQCKETVSLCSEKAWN